MWKSIKQWFFEPKDDEFEVTDRPTQWWGTLTASSRLYNELTHTVDSCAERAAVLRVEIANRTDELADVVRAAAVASGALADLRMDKELGDVVTEVCLEPSGLKEDALHQFQRDEDAIHHIRRLAQDGQHG